MVDLELNFPCWESPKVFLGVYLLRLSCSAGTSWFWFSCVEPTRFWVFGTKEVRSIWCLVLQKNSLFVCFWGLFALLLNFWVGPSDFFCFESNWSVPLLTLYSEFTLFWTAGKWTKLLKEAFPVLVDWLLVCLFFYTWTGLLGASFLCLTFYCDSSSFSFAFASSAWPFCIFFKLFFASESIWSLCCAA